MPIDDVEFYPADAQSLGEMHIGMFFAWAVQRGHATLEWAEDFGAVVEAREGFPSDLAATCDGQLSAEQLAEPLHAFVQHYYRPEHYFEDFEDVVSAKANVFAPADSWKSFDRLASVLDQRLAAFVGARAFQSTRSG